MNRVAPDFSTLAGRRPPLSWMNHGSTREAAGYRRSFVVRGRSAWFAYVRLNHATSLPGGAYEVRACPTWAEAYTWACAKVDRCAVCGRPSNDHGGWNHAYASGPGPVAVPQISTECGWRLGLCTGCEKCEPRPDGPPTKAQWWDKVATRDTPDSPSAVRCSHCLSPAGLGHEQGCRYEHPRT